MPLIRMVLLLMAFWLPSQAWAAANCTINTNQGPAFGIYDAIGPHATMPLDATGTIRINCNGAADDLSVSFNQGNAPAAGSSCALPLRQMSSGANRLRYNLFRDAARTQIWGCTSGTSTHDKILDNGATVNTYTIYGRIPPNQIVATGLYSDTIGITVIF